MYLFIYFPPPHGLRHCSHLWEGSCSSCRATGNAWEPTPCPFSTAGEPSQGTRRPRELNLGPLDPQTRTLPTELTGRLILAIFYQCPFCRLSFLKKTTTLAQDLEWSVSQSENHATVLNIFSSSSPSSLCFLVGGSLPCWRRSPRPSTTPSRPRGTGRCSSRSWRQAVASSWDFLASHRYVPDNLYHSKVRDLCGLHSPEICEINHYPTSSDNHLLVLPT